MHKVLNCKNRQNGYVVLSTIPRVWPKTLMMCLTNLVGLVSETKSGFKNEWYTKMVEQNNEFCYRKNYKVHGRKIPEATALLAPWTPLPHYALSLASSG